MKVLLIGINRRVGVGAESRKPYDICTARYLVPDESGSKNDDKGALLWNYSAKGYRVAEIAASPSALDQYPSGNSVGLVDLIVEPMPQNPARNWVVGFAK